MKDVSRSNPKQRADAPNLNVESLFENLSPHFREEYEFFNKLSQILNKVL
jgi:hypothetical protein